MKISGVNKKTHDPKWLKSDLEKYGKHDYKFKNGLLEVCFEKHLDYNTFRQYYLDGGSLAGFDVSIEKQGADCITSGPNNAYKTN